MKSRNCIYIYISEHTWEVMILGIYIRGRLALVRRAGQKQQGWT